MRQERDRFGVITLPDQCLYGIQTARCIENLSFSDFKLADYPSFLSCLALVKSACAKANQSAGMIEDNIARAIEGACQEIGSGRYRDQFPVDMLHGGGGIAFNVNVNEVIANVANMRLGNTPGSYNPVHPKKHVNASQSTADVCHTALRLTLLSRSEELFGALRRLTQAFAEKRLEFSSISTIARTCLQDAMPVKLSETFGAFEALVKRRCDELYGSIAKLSSVNLGGTVIGSGDGASSEYRKAVIEALSKLCFREIKIRENLYDAAQNIDDIAAVSAQLRLLAQSLIKVAKDLRLLSSGPHAGFGEIYLPQLQEGSSFFFGKVNPILPETLIQACMQVLGCDCVVQAALEHGELNLNVFEGATVKNLLDMLNMLAGAISLFTDKCVNGITANEERCEGYARMGADYVPVSAPAGS